MPSETLRILIVEDEPLIAIDLEETLGREGHAVVVSSTVAEADSLLQIDSFDLAILDYHLAHETTAVLAQRLQSLNISFVLCTGTADPRDLEPAFADAVMLSKPFTTDDLLQAVQRATTRVLA